MGYLVSNVAKRVDVLLCVCSDDASSKKSGVVLKTIECRSFLGNGLEYISVHSLVRFFVCRLPVVGALHWSSVSHPGFRGTSLGVPSRNRGINTSTNFELSRNIPNIPPNFAGIFVRHLAIWGNLCAVAGVSFVFGPVNI